MEEDRADRSSDQLPRALSFRRKRVLKFRDILALILTVLLIFPEVMGAQQPNPAGAAVPTSPSRGLHILVLQGQNAVNSLPLGAAVHPAVQVFDYLGEPVEGAEVTFEVPAAGPGGVFEIQKNSFSTRTDARGQALAPFTPNSLPGSFTIRVIARANEQTAEAIIKQTNSASSDTVEYGPPRSRPWYKDWKWWTVIAAGAGAGGYFAFREGGSSSNPTISLTPGAITIGGLR
jgi:hypothetical protein